MTIADVETRRFRHFVAHRWASPPANRLHVYSEGDGTPWVGNYPNTDPPPRNPLALHLAALDPADVAYVGRPCYFDRAEDRNCNPRYWTSHRYGEDVLQSMAAAIQSVRLERHGEILLIGHSGGGTIAVLLAPRVDGVVGVISIGANLDVAAWAGHHGYDPLAGSLDPARQPPGSTIPHWQLVGTGDRRVPPDVSVHYADRRANVSLREFQGFDHVCCWERDWTGILATVTGELPAYD